MIFAAHAEGILAACFKRISQNGVVTESSAMRAECFFGDFENTDPFDRAGGA